ncbi:MAG: hypothetical protein A3G76_16340 [Acidobacteria bacterium RIFCSPLOWO2_12_FULL_65_11]|nr:MAG: hypothetical protein A3H95_10655 [Acidobacteria bacterium RIFCSPLOWO2_02_FULL_64_15]OFW32238.1 MAG: hypothetical protein A3G76_16340 [Acidobacteria bacterium RIFCSPLOWO2_12_FULL_65_11]
MRKARHVRVKTPAVEVRVAAEHGRLVNISATGALVHTTKALLVGRECLLTLKVSDEAVQLKVRIVRVEFLSPATTHTNVRTYGISLMFIPELTGAAKQAVADLCGPAFTDQE